MRFTALCAAAWLTLAQSAFAASYIRDAEIEHTLRLLANPVFDAAGIPPASVRIFIINDPSINAFVAGGLNMFIHTGLIMNTENPGMLAGVIAHETGHLAGAHLSKLSSATEQASLGALMSYVLGAAAMIGGQGEAGAAIMSAGQNTSMRNLLTKFRGNEQQADQAGIRFLEACGLSPVGMLQMFELLRRNEQQHIGSPDPYLRTHPLTTDRIASLRSAVDASRLKTQHFPKEYLDAHTRAVAKLFAFIETPQKTFKQYPSSDTTNAAHVARAVAWFRSPDMNKALAEANALIAQSPDAFAYDLKGQILFENGRIDDAIAAYTLADEHMPDNGLILTDLARSYLAKEDPKLLPKAIMTLEMAVRADDSNAQTFHNLAIAYGAQGKIGESNLALAHESALKDDPKETLRYAKQAKKQLPPDSPAMLQTEDLIRDAQRLLKEKKDSKLPF
jgi:predicted Zn-dependent protease